MLKNRDGRSFAEVARLGTQEDRPTKSKPTIVLQPDEGINNMMRKISLVGEALSLSHLNHLLVLFVLKEVTDFEIKYIGGLKVLLIFKHSMGAKSFMENRERWGEYFRWVKLWDQNQSMEFDRIASIRIVGLLIQYWGEKNFEDTTSMFGKKISPFDDIPHRVDMSHVKIGIITKAERRINEEIEVLAGGNRIKIGITEFDEDWFPFSFDNAKNPYENDETLDEEDNMEKTMRKEYQIPGNKPTTTTWKRVIQSCGCSTRKRWTTSGQPNDAGDSQ